MTKDLFQLLVRTNLLLRSLSKAHDHRGGPGTLIHWSIESFAHMLSYSSPLQPGTITALLLPMSWSTYSLLLWKRTALSLKRASLSPGQDTDGTVVPGQHQMTFTPRPPTCRSMTKSSQWYLPPAPITTGLSICDIPSQWMDYTGRSLCNQSHSLFQHWPLPAGSETETCRLEAADAVSWS